MISICFLKPSNIRLTRCLFQTSVVLITFEDLTTKQFSLLFCSFTNHDHNVTSSPKAKTLLVQIDPLLQRSYLWRSPMSAVFSLPTAEQSHHSKLSVGLWSFQRAEKMGSHQHRTNRIISIKKMTSSCHDTQFDFPFTCEAPINKMIIFSTENDFPVRCLASWNWLQ